MSNTNTKQDWLKAIADAEEKRNEASEMRRRLIVLENQAMELGCTAQFLGQQWKESPEAQAELKELQS